MKTPSLVRHFVLAGGLLSTVHSALAATVHPGLAGYVPPLAQVPSDLRTGMQAGLGILFLFGFVWGVVKIWNGADKMSKGDADGKMGIISGIIIAGAAAIMTALFTIFGIGGGALTPTFN